MSMQYVTRDTDAERRKRARTKVVTAVVDRGDSLDRFDADEVAWAFEGFEGELAGLPERAAVAAEQRAERQRRAEQGKALTRMTARVLREMEEKEKADRLAAAQAEARRRLEAAGEFD